VAVEGIQHRNYNIRQAHTYGSPDGKRAAANEVDDDKCHGDCHQLTDVQSSSKDQGEVCLSQRSEECRRIVDECIYA